MYVLMVNKYTDSKTTCAGNYCLEFRVQEQDKSSDIEQQPRTKAPLTARAGPWPYLTF